jgi:hypothetical protein
MDDSAESRFGLAVVFCLFGEATAVSGRQK